MTLAETETRPAPVLAQTVAALARQLNKNRLGSGALAQLRRMDPLAIPPPVFWTLLADMFGADPLPPWQERAWAVIIQAMVMTAPDGHRANLPPGRVLAENGYPEGRFVRLLRADGAALATEIRTLARWSAAKALAFDWTDLAALVLARYRPDPSSAESRALGLARAYFLAANKKAGADAPAAAGETA